MVVIPTLLGSQKDIDDLIGALEIRYLGNRDPNLFFALLTDFPDAPECTLPGDAALLAHACAAIEALNRTYRDDRPCIFFLFHRPRVWNPYERTWMGYERKRGKLEQFNALLRGEAQAAFSERVGDPSILGSIRYVITLDTDTQLPRDAARTLVGNMGLINAGPEADSIDKPGGIFVRRAEELSEEDRVLFQTVARVIMASEITRIANATDFNGIYLLNGNLSSATHSGSGLNSTGKLKVHFGSGNLSAEDYYYVQIGCCTASALGLTGQSITEAAYVATHGLTATGTSTLASALQSCSNEPSYWSTDFSGAQTVDTYYDPSSPQQSTSYIFAKNNDGSTWMLKYDTRQGGLFLGDQNLSTAGGGSISTQGLAQKALDTINKAIVSKDKIRANLGALQNRLENTISNLQIQSENLQAAESQITDTDVATEMTSFVREQILTQSAVAMKAKSRESRQGNFLLRI